MRSAQTARHEETRPAQDVAAAERHGLLGTVRRTHLHSRYTGEVT